jgi:hypothetical protein
MNMKITTVTARVVLLLAGFAALAGGCIMADRVVEIVLNDSTCAGWSENHTSANYTSDAMVDYANELEQILEDEDLSREDIVSAHLVRVSYGVTEFSHTHDWTVSGSVTVRRADISDGPAVLFDYANLSVEAALGQDLPVPLQAGGVGVVNRALADFIEGGSPVLVFRVVNSGVVPPPSVADPIRFDWLACVHIQVITSMDVEVPDPF